MRIAILFLLLFGNAAAFAETSPNKVSAVEYTEEIAEVQNYLNAVADCIFAVHDPEKYRNELKKNGWYTYATYLDDGRKINFFADNYIRFFRDNIRLVFSLAKNTIDTHSLLNRNSCSVSATFSLNETKETLEAKFYNRFGFKFETQGQVISKDPNVPTITTSLVDLEMGKRRTFFLEVYSNSLGPKPVSTSVPENKTDLLTHTIAIPATTSEIIAAMSACSSNVRANSRNMNSKIISLGWTEILKDKNRYSSEATKDQETVFVKGHIMLTVYTFEGASACRLIAQISDQDVSTQLKNEAVRAFGLKQPRDSSFAKRNPDVPYETAKTIYESNQITARIKVEQDIIDEKNMTLVNIVIAPKF